MKHNKLERKKINMEKGVLYGVGVGSGDPSLLTIQAAHILKTCDVIACPQTNGQTSSALSIARQYLSDQPILYCDTPMTHDKTIRETSHIQAANIIASVLEQGKTIAFLTLGDPSIYSTYWYIARRVIAQGYEVKTIPGVPSFCAAAAAVNQPLCMDKEPLYIIPASADNMEQLLSSPGNKILMKAGKSFQSVKEYLSRTGLLQNTVCIERCGMDGERIIRRLETLESAPDYFSTLLILEEKS